MNAPEQRTEAWFSERRPITGSRIATALGESPWNKPEDLIRELVRANHGESREFEGNIATQWGTDHEYEAVSMYESSTGNLVTKHNISIHPDHDFISYSADGIAGDVLLEVKAPFSQKIPTEVPNHYWLQVQLGMEVLDLESCDFYYWTPGKQQLFKIPRDRQWFENTLPQLDEFTQWYLNELDNPDHLESKQAAFEGEEAEALALAYLEAKRRVDSATEAEKAAKRAIVEYVGSRSAKGCGIQVVKTERKGNLKYAQYVKDNNLDIPESYRGKGSTSFAIRKYDR